MTNEGTVYNAQGRINRISVLCIDAYGVAVKNGFEGTVDEWLESLVGDTGKSAYEYAKENGYEGTEEEFAEDLSLLPGIIKNASTAIQSANTAAGKANTATQNANTAAQNANSAATAANNARVSFLETAGNALEEIRNIVNDGTDAPPIVSSTRGEVITLNDSADRLLRGLKVFGKTEQNGTPTPETPVPLESVGDSVNVTVCGKNLIPYPYLDSGKSFTIIKDNGDGSLTINGTTDKNIFFNLALDVDFGDSYVSTYSSATSGGRTFSISKTTVAGVYMGYQVNPNKGLFIKVETGNTFDNVTIYPQIEYGNVSTDWESPNHQNILVSTSNGLPGIPVNSGGNYTDSSGQQWLCDEVDFEKGVYVKRINQFEADAETTWVAEFTGQYRRFVTIIPATFEDARQFVLCNRGKFSATSHDEGTAFAIGAAFYYYKSGIDNVDDFTAWTLDYPITAFYVLESPEYKNLTADQLAAFAALHSNYPNTTVFNDKNAGMEVKYVADTKLYIDQKFAELAAAIVNN